VLCIAQVLYGKSGGLLYILIFTCEWDAVLDGYSLCWVLMLYPTDVSLKYNAMLLYGRQEAHLVTRKIIALFFESEAEY
jgi:hypothetical protein